MGFNCARSQKGMHSGPKGHVAIESERSKEAKCGVFGGTHAREAVAKSRRRAASLTPPECLLIVQTSRGARRQ